MNYGEYDAADFAADASFRAWVLHGRDAGGFWASWQSAHPEKDALLYDARAIVLALQFRPMGLGL